MCSCVGDDRELCALEWRHWRMAAGKLTLHKSCSLWFNLHVFKTGNSVKDYLSVMYVSVLLFFVFQKCVAYTGNNMRKQTPAPDKKEKDVSSLFSAWDCFCVTTVVVDLFLFTSLMMYEWPQSSSDLVSCSHLRWISPMCIWPTQRRACGSH